MLALMTPCRFYVSVKTHSRKGRSGRSAQGRPHGRSQAIVFLMRRAARST